MARGRRNSGGHRYPRSARVGETLREIIAEELVRLDDERLTFVTVTGIEVDDELNRAHVYFDSLAGEDGDDEIVDALTSHRIRLQSAIARQIRAKKTPILDFRPDIAIRSAERIDGILREDRKRRGDTAANDTAANDTAANDTAANDTAANDTAANDTAADDTAADDTAADDTAADDTATNDD